MVEFSTTVRGRTAYSGSGAREGGHLAATTQSTSSHHFLAFYDGGCSHQAQASLSIKCSL